MVNNEIEPKTNIIEVLASYKRYDLHDRAWRVALTLRYNSSTTRRGQDSYISWTQVATAMKTKESSIYNRFQKILEALLA
jgi:hypothetical protein